MNGDPTTLQWARLLDAGAQVRIVTVERIAEGRLRSIGRRCVELDYPPGEHDGFSLVVPRSGIRKVLRRDGEVYRRVRIRRPV